jgi:hypothetical protein
MWEILDKIEKRISDLHDKAKILVQPEPAISRELTTLIYQEIVIPFGSMEEQKVTIYNGDRDEWVIQRLAATVLYDEVASQQLRIVLLKHARGWASTTGVPPEIDFDFVWNYAVNSRQSLYSRDNAASSANYLTSSVLANLDSARMLDWQYPLIIPPSDSIEFRVKPICTRPTPTRFYVGFVGVGYRRML